MSDEKNLPATIDPFSLMQRQARAYAGSTLVPESMRTFENALAAMMMADEMGESRLAVMQNLYFIHGRPGWITTFMIGRANRAHKFKGPLRWRTKQKDEDNIVVECYGKLPDSDDEISVEIDLKTAIDAGWTTYKDTKDHNKIKTHARWNTPAMIEQMLRWRTGAWLIRLYAPETMMGLPTKEELEDISGSPEMIDVTPIKAPALKEFTEADRRASYERAGVPLDVAEPTEAVEPGPKPSEEAVAPPASAGTVDEAGNPSEADAGHPRHEPASAQAEASPTPKRSVAAAEGTLEIEEVEEVEEVSAGLSGQAGQQFDEMVRRELVRPQNPEDRPPARPPTALSPLLSPGAGSAQAEASPTPVVASHTYAIPIILSHTYAIPMILKNKKPDLRGWVVTALLPALLKAKRPEVVACTIGDNHEHIDAYKATLPPLERRAFENELKKIAEEAATNAQP